MFGFHFIVLPTLIHHEYRIELYYTRSMSRHSAYNIKNSVVDLMQL